jgi:hypothetical protein
MAGFELQLAEAAALLGYPKDSVALLVERGQLLAEGSGDSLRISLTSIAHYVGVNAEQTAVQGVQQVFRDHDAWNRVFGSRPEVSAPTEFERFPRSLMGYSLSRAVEIAGIRSA